MGLAVAAMTAFYMFRLYHMTFSGTFRGTEDQWHHVHESPRTMVLPLQVLAVGSILAGLLGIPAVLGHALHIPNVFEHFTEPVFAAAHRTLPQVFTATPPAHAIEMGLMATSVIIAAFGIALAWLLFRRHPEVPARVASSIAPAYRLLLNKYYVDEIYGALFVRGAALGGGTTLHAVDRFVVDGGDGEVRPGLGVNGLGWFTREVATSWTGSST
jgi:NADH-quinone oxidoreductase subunit L